MAKKVLLLLALVCMVVPFMVAGYCASADVVDPGGGYMIGSARFEVPNTTVYDDFPFQVYTFNTTVTNLWEDDFVTIESPKLGFEWRNFEANLELSQFNAFVSLRVNLPNSINLKSLQIIVLGADMNNALYVNGIPLNSYSMEQSNFLGLVVSGKDPDNTDAFQFSLVTGDMVVEDTVQDDIYYEFKFTNPTDNADLDILGFIVRYTNSNNVTEAYNNGYNTGYTAGQNNANATINYDSASYQQGRLDGIDSANQYTFLDLMGAVFDAPIRALFGYVENGVRVDGLFTLDILGVNLSSFLLSIFTLGIVITIVRLCLGGK